MAATLRYNQGYRHKRVELFATAKVGNVAVRVGCVRCTWYQLHVEHVVSNRAASCVICLWRFRNGSHYDSKTLCALLQATSQLGSFYSPSLCIAGMRFAAVLATIVASISTQDDRHVAAVSAANNTEHAATVFCLAHNQRLTPQPRTLERFRWIHFPKAG